MEQVKLLGERKIEEGLLHKPQSQHEPNLTQVQAAADDFFVCILTIE